MIEQGTGGSIIMNSVGEGLGRGYFYLGKKNALSASIKQEGIFTQ
jgi:hypothetical protein